MNLSKKGQKMMMGNITSMTITTSTGMLVHVEVGYLVKIVRQDKYINTSCEIKEIHDSYFNVQYPVGTWESVDYKDIINITIVKNNEGVLREVSHDFWFGNMKAFRGNCPSCHYPFARTLHSEYEQIECDGCFEVFTLRDVEGVEMIVLNGEG
jgi:hypothetical protein